MDKKTPITIAIIAKNESSNIKACLQSVSEIASEIIVFDDMSSDNTAEIAASLGAKVKTSEANLNFSEKRNFCLSQSQSEWVFFLDADERPDGVLISWLSHFKPSSDTAAYRIKRVDTFWNTRLTHGEVFDAANKGILRLVSCKHVKYEGAVHERAVFGDGKISRKGEGIIDHHPHKTIIDFVNHINLYSSLRAEELSGLKSSKIAFLEMIVFPPAKFFYTYFLKLGFLDGPAGFAYSFLMSFHSFLVRAKLLAKSK